MGKLGKLKRVNWLLVFELARMTHGHVMEATSPQDRRRVMEIVRRSHGNPRRVSAADKAELKRIAAQLDLKRLLAGAGPSVLMRGRKR